MNTFKKEERLCNKKLLEQLFHKGSSFLCYPYRVSWLAVPDEKKFAVQVVFPVAKKRFKRAIDRNFIKRRMREAYRLNKQENLYGQLNSGRLLLLSISYIGKEIEDFELMESKMLKLFKQLTTTVNNETVN